VGCRCTSARGVVAAYARVLTKDHILGRRRLVSAVGTVRRIEALHAIGWPGSALGARLGVTEDALRQWRSRTIVNIRTAESVAKLYDALSMTPGPSPITKSRAARYGWAPPLAWDDDNIDDPAATPAGVGLSSIYAAPIEDIEMLVDTGHTWITAPARLGVTRNVLEKRLHRLGRTDLTARLGRASAAGYAAQARRNQWSA
jgi:hypothetical protein